MSKSEVGWTPRRCPALPTSCGRRENYFDIFWVIIWKAKVIYLILYLKSESDIWPALPTSCGRRENQIHCGNTSDSPHLFFSSLDCFQKKIFLSRLLLLPSPCVAQLVWLDVVCKRGKSRWWGPRDMTWRPQHTAAYLLQTLEQASLTEGFHVQWIVNTHWTYQ